MEIENSMEPGLQETEKPKKPEGPGKFWTRLAAALTVTALISGAGLGYALHGALTATGMVRAGEMEGNGTEEIRYVVENTTSPVVPIAEKVLPSIVAIETTSSVNTLFGTRMENRGTGSGVVYDREGHIVTNNHVVEGTDSLTVVTHDGREYPAQLVGRDSRTDLAVIRVEGLDALPVTWGKSSDLKVGELAVALGSPLGTDFAGSVTAGIISGLDRRITVGDRSLQLIQTDAAINPGNSGGALVNSAGELVGINSAKIASSQVEGMGFAIPSDEAGPIVEQLITGQEVIRPALGISGSTITEEDSRRYSIPRGVYVQQVVPYGGADRAGLVRGDIITAIDGIPVETIEELVAQVGEKQVGDTVTLTITDRQNREKELEVVLSRQNTEE